MEEELKSFIKACASVIISVSYCYYVPPRIKCGVVRLFSVLPVSALFFLLPLPFSSAHFIFITSNFLSWLASVKLILFAFDKGPLFPFPLSFTQFICFTCLPIHPLLNPKSHDHFPKWVFTVKVAIFGVFLSVFNYTRSLPPVLLLGLYPLHLYLLLEIPLTLLKFVLTITLRSDLEPYFNEPYLATSLQDFWGRRWNLPVSAIIRSSVYMPVQQVCQHLMNVENAKISGILASFLVSGLIHELMLFYITREAPTWEVTWFFVLNGVCTVVERIVKKRKAFTGRWMVRPPVSQMLTVGFVAVTGGLWFFAQITRNRVIERFISESLLFTEFFNRDFFTFLGVK